MSDTLTLAVEGMTCASCVGRVERAVAGLEGVESVAVNLMTESATVTGSGIEAARIAEAIRDAGYEAHELVKADSGTGASASSTSASKASPEDALEASRSKHAGFDFDTRMALALTVPVVVLTMLPMAVPALHATPLGAVMHFFMGIGGLVLSAPVLLFAGRRFFRQALGEIEHRSLGMSTLVALGSSAAFVFSSLVVLVPGLFPEGNRHTYFEAAMSIVTLVLVGKSLEAKARGRATEAIAKLVALRPSTAHVLRTDASGVETEVDVPIGEVGIGERVVLRPGEAVPVDGTVVSGESYVDESSVTGEPFPVEKKAGATVLAGTHTGQGSLVVRAERIGESTTLGQVITLVQNAQSGKSEAQALADRVAGIFVPVVLAIAALTFAAWMVLGPAPALSHALVSAVSVLVAACPCAMGLATPAALVVSTGRAAELGVLLRKTSALDVLARVDTVVLDKTGTLTRGTPSVTQVKSFVAGADTSNALALAAAVEARSEHPVGRAIFAYAKASPEASRALGTLVLDAFRSIPGGGAEGRVSGREVLVGKPDLLASRGLLDGIDEASRLGTSAFVAIDGKVALGFVVEDEQRPEAKKAIAALRELGIVPILASGDAEGPVSSLARELGIEEAHGSETPTSKAARVTALREAKKTVAFVGDGVNDAAALAVADVGIAMGTGSDVAVSAGDVVLVRSDLFAFVDAVRLARSTKRVVSENFFWAYAYNAALIPLAAGALEPWLGLSLSPMLASAAMAASSLFVLGNSLRLKRFRRSGP